MNPRELLRSRALLAAVIALVIASGTVVWVTVRAARVDPVLAALPPRFATADALGATGTIPIVDVRGVVELNVFSPDRTAPLRRYRLSGWDEEPTAVAELPQPVVLGTAVSTAERTFAIAKVGGGQARVVRVGDILEGYTVRLIERGHVVFMSPTGERLEIRSNQQD
jgi:hypothetical protein